MTESIHAAAELAGQDSATVHQATLDRRAAQIIGRYSEGYIHARAVEAFGNVVKLVALVGGSLIAFGGLISCSAGGFGEVSGIVLMLTGVVIGGLGFVLSVLIKSSGQLMKAQFDCAVNGSHFLTDDQRATVMSIT
jgi:hypothetical protein